MPPLYSSAYQGSGYLTGSTGPQPLGLIDWAAARPRAGRDASQKVACTACSFHRTCLCQGHTQSRLGYSSAVAHPTWARVSERLELSSEPVGRGPDRMPAFLLLHIREPEDPPGLADPPQAGRALCSFCWRHLAYATHHPCSG